MIARRWRQRLHDPWRRGGGRNGLSRFVNRAAAHLRSRKERFGRGASCWSPPGRIDPDLSPGREALRTPEPTNRFNPQSRTAGIAALRIEPVETIAPQYAAVWRLSPTCSARDGPTGPGSARDWCCCLVQGSRNRCCATQEIRLYTAANSAGGRRGDGEADGPQQAIKG